MPRCSISCSAKPAIAAWRLIQVSELDAAVMLELSQRLDRGEWLAPLPATACRCTMAVAWASISSAIRPLFRRGRGCSPDFCAAR